MSIISTSMLTSRLPGISDGDTALNVINRGTSFVNTWTSKRYDPWDDFTESPEAAVAPYEIVEICLEVSEVFYYLDIGQKSRDGNDLTVYHDFLKGKKEELLSIDISPTWHNQAISLNSNKNMVIGNRTSGTWTRVIPFNANIISNGTSIWTHPQHWTIRKGGNYVDEYTDAWYLDCNTGYSVEGTLKYMRTYRKDCMDYARYSK